MLRRRGKGRIRGQKPEARSQGKPEVRSQNKISQALTERHSEMLRRRGKGRIQESGVGGRIQDSGFRIQKVEYTRSAG
jgi:hypothetical protein